MGTAVLQGLARHLVSHAQITESEAVKALEQAQSQGRGFADHIVSENLVNARQVALSASQLFGTPVLDLDAFDLEQAPRDAVEPKVVIESRALPLYRRGNRLFVAVADPTDLKSLDSIQFASGLSTEAIVVEADKLNRAIEAFTGGKRIHWGI